MNSSSACGHSKVHTFLSLLRQFGLYIVARCLDTSVSLLHMACIKFGDDVLC
jgi:hypothetical protein